MKFLFVFSLSAHAIGKLLGEKEKEIWDRRDKFQLIVFVDFETSKSNYTGTIVERLIKTIVEVLLLFFYNSIIKLLIYIYLLVGYQS